MGCSEFGCNSSSDLRIGACEALLELKYLGCPSLVYVIKNHLSVTKGQMQTESRAEQIHFHIAKNYPSISSNII